MAWRARRPRPRIAACRPRHRVGFLSTAAPAPHRRKAQRSRQLASSPSPIAVRPCAMCSRACNACSCTADKASTRRCVVNKGGSMGHACFEPVRPVAARAGASALAVSFALSLVRVDHELGEAVHLLSGGHPASSLVIAGVRGADHFSERWSAARQHAHPPDLHQLSGSVADQGDTDLCRVRFALADLGRFATRVAAPRASSPARRPACSLRGRGRRRADPLARS